MSVVAASPIGYQWPGRTAQLDALVQWRLPYSAQLMSATGAAPATDTQPITEPGIAKTGAAGGSFADDWYNTIHIRPSTLALGNLLSTQTRDVEVWNAYFDSEALNTLSAQGADGLSLSAPASPPTTFAALESRIYTARIDTNGPPTINASYTFGFAVGDRVLSITGKRVVVFAFAPNWADNVTEQLSWLTDVMTAVDGTEQRVALRSLPRRTISYSLFAEGTDAARLDGVLWSWQSRTFALPVWIDAQRLTSPVSVGDTAISIDTTERDYRDGGLVVLISSPGTYEAIEIATVSDGGLQLARGLGGNWPAGTRIAPVRLARLPTQVKLSRQTAGWLTGSVAFDVIDNAGGAAAAELDDQTYRGWPVLTRQPNRKSAIDETYTRTRNEIDNDTGIVTIDDLSQQAIDLQTWQMIGVDRSDVYALRRWLHARQGKLSPFWAPTWHRDLEIVETVNASATLITVTDIAYRRFGAGMPGRRDIALLHRDGTWYFRRVLAANAGDPGTEQLSLDSQIGVTADPDDWRIICFLVPLRLSSDSATFKWRSAGVASLSLATRSVVA